MAAVQVELIAPLEATVTAVPPLPNAARNVIIFLHLPVRHAVLSTNICSFFPLHVCSERANDDQETNASAAAEM